MANRWTLLAVLVLVLTVLPAIRPAAADGALPDLPSVALSQLRDGETPFGQAIFLRDPGGALDIDAALEAGGWRPLTAGEGNQGITDAGFFVAFRLVNDTQGPRVVVVSHNVMQLSRFALRAEAPDGSVTRQSVPSDQPVADRIVDYTGPAAAVFVPAGATRDVVVAMRNDFAIPLHIAIALWGEKAFERHAIRNTALSTALAASLATTSMFWLLYGIVMMQGRLIFYALYLAFTAYTLTNFFGLGYQLLYPSSAGLQRLGFHWSMFLLVAAALEFARRHLELASLHPRDDRILRVAIFANLAASLFAIVVQRPEIEAPLTFASLSATPVAIAWLSWRAWRRDGIAYSKWMVIGWGALSITVLPSIFGSLVNVPVLPLTQMDFLQVAFVIAVFESLILSISLANWLRGLEVRRVAAELAAAQDPLTGLLNRRGFTERSLAVRTADGWPDDVWLAVIDIDRFKLINDEYGHAGGDLVLQRLALLLGEACRDGEIAARYGGEEFVLMFRAPSQPDAKTTLERLRRGFANVPTSKGDAQIAHSFSAGLVRAGDHPGSDPDGLVALADAALYAAKRMGRNRVHIFSRHPVTLAEAGNAGARLPRH